MREMARREQILAAIRSCASKLGRTPTVRELMENTELSEHRVRVVFGSCTRALQAAGLKPAGSSRRPSLRDLFLDWIHVARKSGRIPTGVSYARYSKFSIYPLTNRFGRWSQVPAAVETYILDNNLREQYQDILEMVASYRQPRQDATIRPAWKARKWQDRPVYGAPMVRGALLYEPVNEAGVMVLFGALAEDLGFSVIRVQTEFPDCLATCEVEPGRCQEVRIEFEFVSRNFREHKHDFRGCDIIVCWEHNWPNCPLPVLELRSEVRRLIREKQATV